MFVIIICIYRIRVQVCLDSPDYDKPVFLKVGKISTARAFLKSFRPRLAGIPADSIRDRPEIPSRLNLTESGSNRIAKKT